MDLNELLCVIALHPTSTPKALRLDELLDYETADQSSCK